jgi:hypothetical protein
MRGQRPRRIRHIIATVSISLAASGCTHFGWDHAQFDAKPHACPKSESVVGIAQIQRFREAETERAKHLAQEIDRLQSDLRTAEAALVEAESGLAGSSTRADSVSALAVTRIQIERAASRAPWRSREIKEALAKLTEAERQVDENRFGAALFFVYRARRVAESILDEASVVRGDKNTRLIQAENVNLRAGPSNTEPILSVLKRGTPVFPQVDKGSWVLVQVSGGPAGWVHRRLLGAPVSIDDSDSPAATP